MRGLLSLMLAIPLAVGCGDDGGDDKPEPATDERIEGTEAGDCSDGSDNDLDGIFDCDEAECAGSPDCEETDADDGGSDDGAADDTGTSDADGDTDGGGSDDGTADDTGTSDADGDTDGGASDDGGADDTGSASTDSDSDGFTVAEGDCDDESSAFSPVATDMVGDGIDQNCDGIDGLDADGDGFASESTGGDDCDDSRAEVLGYSVDADCDTALTEDDCDDTTADLGAMSEDGDCDTVLTADDCDDSDATMPISDADCDTVLTTDDCDDGDPSTVDDMDCDGTSYWDDCDDDEPEIGSIISDADCDGVLTADDCDDGDPTTADDMDCDGLSDEAEEMHGTDPFDEDTDGDGFDDAFEVMAGTDPTDASSVVEGVYIIVPEGTSVEQNFEFEIGIQMADIAFLLDTTCSMGETANALASEFSAIVTSLSSIIPDAEYGSATYDDYAFAGFGSAASGDKPFILRQQITDNTAAVQGSLSSVSIHSGGDGPESTMEALYQSATGAGYDQNCNGIYDSATDVKPFFATSDDPYGGTAGQGFSATSSGGGEIGGFGFRDYALPILIYATDNELRDPEAGYPSPGGCPMDAHRSDVVDALADLRGYTIGIMTSSGGGTGPVSQMEELGEATGSMADIDGDGVADDLLVFTWTGSSSAFREIITSSVGDLVNSTQFSTVKLLVEGDDWSPVDDEDEDVEHDTGTTDTETTDTETTDTGSVDGDSETDETEDAASEELGFVRSIEPAVYEDIEPAAGFDVLDFTIQFEGIVPAMTHDQLFSITLNVVGDDTILLDTRDIIIVVPGLGS